GLPWKHRCGPGSTCRSEQVGLLQSSRHLRAGNAPVARQRPAAASGSCTGTVQDTSMGEKIANCGKPLGSFDETVRTALDLLENPLKRCSFERLEYKQAVLKLAFAERL